jgi:16S rRNA (uracil1498-N3)-methyltransferase
MNIFYNPYIQGDTVQLDEQESKHAIRVLRLKKGDSVSLVDGVGGWYEAEVEEEHSKRCRLKITSRIPSHQPLPYRLHLAISPTKSMDRFEWFLEKSTEIGISEVTPLLCHRTERTRINPDRMERILVSAMKQSLRAFKPILHDPVPLVEFIREKRDGIQGIAHCIQEGEGAPFERIGLTALLKGTSYTMLVGPEGDFTEEELNMSLKKGFKPFHLGESRLRTETAGVYICAAISYSHTF